MTTATTTSPIIDVDVADHGTTAITTRVGTATVDLAAAKAGYTPIMIGGREVSVSWWEGSPDAFEVLIEGKRTSFARSVATRGDALAYAVNNALWRAERYERNGWRHA